VPPLALVGDPTVTVGLAGGFDAGIAKAPMDNTRQKLIYHMAESHPIKPREAYA
jgi:hypothetical protein